MNLRLALAAFVGMAALQAHAQLFTVDAQLNSSSGGAGLATVSLNPGDWFAVQADPTDLWNAGPLPRWSNADGLTGPLFATGTDDSGFAAGTQIGANFGTWMQDGFTAPYGSLVGKIGSSYLLLGTSFSGPAPEAGTLTLFYWDSDSLNNTQSIDVLISVRDQSAVPEPGTYALFGAAALAALVAHRRLRRRNA